MNPVLDAAFKRAFIYAVIAAISAVGAALYTDQTVREIIAYAIAMSMPVFLARWVGEGVYDTQRAINGDVNKGDVPEASNKLEVIKVPGPVL